MRVVLASGIKWERVGWETDDECFRPASSIQLTLTSWLCGTGWLSQSEEAFRQHSGNQCKCVSTASTRSLSHMHPIGCEVISIGRPTATSCARMEPVWATSTWWALETLRCSGQLLSVHWNSMFVVCCRCYTLCSIKAFLTYHFLLYIHNSIYFIHFISSSSYTYFSLLHNHILIILHISSSIHWGFWGFG